ncbi:MAG: hypothetical protein JXB03_11060 [Spirochaetales bacterium]|nr:hypothetical protein [Spirochaetales bacterium]
MKIKILWCVISLIAVSFQLPALEVGSLFHFSNLDFSKNRDSADTDMSGYDYVWGLTLYGTIPVSDSMYLKIGNFYDPILQNTVYNLIGFEQNYVKILVGPFFGIIHNNDNLIQSGLSTTVRIDLPGVFFLSFMADSSIGGRLVKKGDYIQEKNGIEAGFYVPNAVCSVGLETKTYTRKHTSSEQVTGFTEYFFKTDIFKKNVPYRILLTFAYQTQTIDYVTETLTTTHTLNSLVMGTKLTARVSDNVQIILDLESNVYSFGSAEDIVLSLPDSGLGMYLFRSSTGVVVNF